ncbi:hypothetical protein L211DRAFT_826935 [Terfezia boudieri ATCC MYA-4762]|uniref:WD40 repeat-like protein n=1 Tax=Terfezia boudieri ATCC MYA-4762 TaxID=1051890 RepID=A0A3N4LM12_9PEZI|nr:hypothetical protein L211DRAFT_826935 [Terfezia boudieri ATCC MYA-4762]
MEPPPQIRRSGRLQPPSRRLELDSDLFSLSTHPTERLLATGESSGRVGVWGWPEEENVEDNDDDDEKKEEEEKRGNEQWWQKTWSAKRHKGSARCVRFSGDGEVLFSTGTDSLLKAASTSTGKVISKSWLPGTTGNGSKPSDLVAPVTVLLPLNPQHILVGTDAAKIHLLDLRTSATSSTQMTQSTLPTAMVSTWTPEAPIDYISSLIALPPGTQSTSGYSYHFLATGGGYLFHMDSRRPGKILHTSEDQGDELLCSLVVEEWPGAKPHTESKETGKILTGFGSGVLGIWNRGAYEGHYERINVSKAAPTIAKKSKRQKTSSALGGGESVDSGTGDGRVKVIRIGGNPGVNELAEEEEPREAVLAVEVTSEGRVVSGGGSCVTMFSEAGGDEGGEEGELGMMMDGSDSGEDSEKDSDGDGDGWGSDSSEDGKKGKREKEKEKRRKRKKNKAIGRPAQKPNVIGNFAGLD